MRNIGILVDNYRRRPSRLRGANDAVPKLMGDLFRLNLVRRGSGPVPPLLKRFSMGRSLYSSIFIFYHPKATNPHVLVTVEHLADLFVCMIVDGLEVQIVDRIHFPTIFCLLRRRGLSEIFRSAASKALSTIIPSLCRNQPTLV